MVEVRRSHWRCNRQHSNHCDMVPHHKRTGAFTDWQISKSSSDQSHYQCCYKP
ncbi:hypothetical protein COOONC_01516 [Cooperia oncophora]